MTTTDFDLSDELLRRSSVCTLQTSKQRASKHPLILFGPIVLAAIDGNSCSRVHYELGKSRPNLDGARLASTPVLFVPASRFFSTQGRQWLLNRRWPNALGNGN
jgi:hypothetical protein